MRIMSKGAIASSITVVAGGITLPSISNCEFFFDARDTQSGSEQANDTALASWRDLSGNGNNLGQDSDTAQPRYYTNIQNGHPGVSFDGSSDYMTGSMSSVSQPWTIAFIINANAGARHIVGSDSVNVFITSSGSSGAGTDTYQINAGTLRNSNVNYDTTLNNVMAGYDGIAQINGFIRKNGVDGSVSSNPGSNAWVDLCLGARGGNYDRFFSGYMFVVAMYSKIFDGTDISTWESWASSNWDA